MNYQELIDSLRETGQHHIYRDGKLMMDAAEAIERLSVAPSAYNKAVARLAESLAKLMIDHGGKHGGKVLISPSDIKSILAEYQEAVFGKEASR